MEIFLSTVIGDITTRSIDFVISKLPKPAAAAPDVEDRLHRVLLRAQVIVDEAMGRQVTPQAMLQQLGLLSDARHRGCYLLDTSRYQSSSHSNKDRRQVAVSHPSSLLSRLNSVVRDVCFPSGKRAPQIEGEMREALDRLSSMILDADELVLFLASHAPASVMYRQPYSMHLLLGNCMFGRQMEAQFVIDFLLHTQHHPSAEEELEVLPIVGAFRVGKSTLVAHVCKDQRVHGHFSETVILSDHDLTSYDGLAAAFREGRRRCATKHQNSSTSTSCKDGPVLLVVEIAGDLDEHVWNRFYSASKRWVPIGSKIIITSRSDKISRLGTTQALILKPLSREAYWYFFRTLAFGSADPMSSHPRLTNLAMEIATMLNGSMIIANVSARMLRDSFDVRFWGKLAAFMRAQFQRHVARLGGHPYDLVNQNKPVYFGRIHRRSEQVIAYHQYRHSSSQKEVPNITLHDVTYGDAELPGRFEVLAWRSAIPPYYSYVYACELQVLKPTSGNSDNKRKRSVRNGGTRS